MGLVNPIQRRREKKRELSLRIESRASKDSRLFLGRAMETERGQRLGQGHESESASPHCSVRAALFPHVPSQHTESGSPPTRQLAYLSWDLWNSWVFPRIYLLLCVYSQRPTLHPQTFVWVPRPHFHPWLACISPTLQGCWPSLSLPRTEAPE